MNPLLLADAEESLYLLKRLYDMAEQNKEEFARCVKGELTEEYSRSMDSAEELIGEIRKTLIVLQSR